MTEDGHRHHWLQEPPVRGRSRMRCECGAEKTEGAKWKGSDAGFAGSSRQRRRGPRRVAGGGYGGRA